MPAILRLLPQSGGLGGCPVSCVQRSILCTDGGRRDAVVLGPDSTRSVFGQRETDAPRPQQARGARMFACRWGPAPSGVPIILLRSVLILVA